MPCVTQFYVISVLKPQPGTRRVCPNIFQFLITFFFPPHIPFYIQVTFFFKGNKLEICFSLFFFLLYRFIHEVKTKTQTSNQNNKNLCTLIFTLFIFFFFLQCKYCVLSHTIALIASWHSHTSVTPIGRPNSVTHELGRENSKLTQFTVHSLWQCECP